MSNQNSTHTHTPNLKAIFQKPCFPLHFTRKKSLKKPQLAGGLRSLYFGDFIHQKPLQISGWWVCKVHVPRPINITLKQVDESMMNPPFLSSLFVGMFSSPTRKQWHMSIAHLTIVKVTSFKDSFLQTLTRSAFLSFWSQKIRWKFASLFPSKEKIEKKHWPKKNKTTQNSWRQTSIRISDKHLG